MLIKAIIKSVLFLLVLLLMCWIPRLLFNFMNESQGGLVDLFSYNYLKTSTLFDLKTLSYWFGLLLIIMAIEWFYPRKFIKRVKLTTAFLLILSFLLYCFIAVFYFPLTKTIVGKELFSIIGGQEWPVIISYIRDYWWAIPVLIILSAVLTQLLMLPKFTLSKPLKFLYIFIIFCSWAIAARGSFSLKPLNHLDAYEQLEADLAVSAMSPAYILLESIPQKGLSEFKYMSDSELQKWQQNDIATLKGSDSIKNICIIILESFGLEYTGMNRDNRPSYTPFLDSLTKHSIYCTNAYANGLRSMDAVASIFTGVPALMPIPYLSSLYAHNDVVSIYDLFKPLGYTSSFYHGADEQSMGFKPFLKSHGLDEYYGKQSYPFSGHDDGSWGIYDHHYFSYYADELSKKTEPWISTVFSLSSHHPYSVPKEFQYLPKGNLPIHQSIAYTDAALKHFFTEAAKSKWYENTVFVITADHSSINESRMYQTANGKYAIPLFIYSPTADTAAEVNANCQHLDILPSLVSLCGRETKLMTFGRSVLHGSEKDIIHFDGGVYSITSKNLTLSMAGDKVISLFNNNLDPQHTKNLMNSLPKEVKILAHNLKAYIQNYNHRIISNTYH